MPTKFMNVCNTILYLHESDWTLHQTLRNDSSWHSKNMLCLWPWNLFSIIDNQHNERHYWLLKFCLLKAYIRKLRFYSLHSCPTPHITCMYLNPDKHKLDTNRQLFPQIQLALCNWYQSVLRSQFKTESSNYKLIFSL
jgi:hypothetical protein